MAPLIFNITTFCHPRMFLSGIQDMDELDSRFRGNDNGLKGHNYEKR